jgi:MFS transporter, MHS family, proline/betaine transporter
VAVTGNDYMPAFYLMAAALVSIGPILSIPETARASIAGTGRPGTSWSAPARRDHHLSTHPR